MSGPGWYFWNWSSGETFGPYDDKPEAIAGRKRLLGKAPNDNVSDVSEIGPDVEYKVWCRDKPTPGQEPDEVVEIAGIDAPTYRSERIVEELDLDDLDEWDNESGIVWVEDPDGELQPFQVTRSVVTNVDTMKELPDGTLEMVEFIYKNDGL